MFVTIFKNSLKILLRDKTSVFWTVVFTILLAILFKMAFSNFENTGKFSALPIAVNENMLEDKFFSKYIAAVEEMGYIETVDLSADTPMEKEAEKSRLFDTKRIVAYVENDDKVVLAKGSSKPTEMVIKTVMDMYIQSKSMVLNILEENPNANFTEIMAPEKHIEDKSSDKINLINTFFYTLLGMQAMYSYIWGLRVMYMYEANLSTQGKRNSISPNNKITSIIASGMAAWVLSLASGIVSSIFIYFVLKIDLGTKFFEILSILALGTLSGVTVGMFIAVSNKKSIDVKYGIGIAISMLCSFLAGMMIADIKILIQKNIPLLNKFNPVALVTDGLYSLYYYDNLNRFYDTILFLALVCVFSILGTLYFVRGKKYDRL